MNRAVTAARVSLWGHLLRWNFYEGNFKLDSFCTIPLESFWLDNSFQTGSEKNLVSLPQFPHPCTISEILPFRVPLPHVPAHPTVKASAMTGTPCAACNWLFPVTSTLLIRLFSLTNAPAGCWHPSFTQQPLLPPALQGSEPQCPAVGFWVFRTGQPMASPLGYPSVFPLTSLPLW